MSVIMYVQGGGVLILILALIWFFFFGLAFLNSMIKYFRNKEVFKGQTEAVIQEVDRKMEKETDADGDTTVRTKTEITYTYDVDGVEYTGRANGKVFSRRYRKICIYYNPEEPDKSITKEDFGLGSFIKSSIFAGGSAVIFIIVGAVILMFFG